MKIQSVKDLEQIREEYSKRLYYPEAVKVNIGMASCGIAERVVALGISPMMGRVRRSTPVVMSPRSVQLRP